MLSLAKRLPLNVPIVSAIHQFTSGPPLSSQLSKLKQRLQQWVETGSTLESSTKAEVASALKQIEAVIRFNTHRSAQGSANSTATALPQGGTHSVVTAPHTYAPDGGDCQNYVRVETRSSLSRCAPRPPFCAFSSYRTRAHLNWWHSGLAKRIGCRESKRPPRDRSIHTKVVKNDRRGPGVERLPPDSQLARSTIAQRTGWRNKRIQSERKFDAFTATSHSPPRAEGGRKRRPVHHGAATVTQHASRRKLAVRAPAPSALCCRRSRCFCSRVDSSHVKGEIGSR